MGAPSPEGFRKVGEVARKLVSAARPVSVDLRSDFPVGDCVATVLEAEGAAQLIWHRGEVGQLAGRALWNGFLTPGMGDELRRLAAQVDAALAALEKGR